MRGVQSSGGTFNVNDYGAKGSGDISQAVMKAWEAACASPGPSTVLIPTGNYIMGEVLLEGPCKGSKIGFQLDGVVKAPADVSAFKSEGWVVFNHVDGLTVSGKGTFDGQGQKAWAANNCDKDENCNRPPMNIRFNFLKNAVVRDITSMNSKMFHINVLECDNISFQHVTISAPGTSINTDGIHIGLSRGVTITDTNIATGDDCVSIGPGSQNVTVTKVNCGPGHGISVGSLGKYKDEKDVRGITVTGCTFTGTSNGVRVKTWPDSPPGVATDMAFEDLTMKNVQNPVILDQEYCPYGQCSLKAPSRVKLSNIKFNNIRGTSSGPDAIVIACSHGFPCSNLEIGEINLALHAAGAPANSTCTNAKPIFSGKQVPAIKCA
uniref:Pollen allergen Pla o 2 n=1 Tax=Platanus orientalis TaxID=122832 RepID=A9YUH5_PLAOI|nr:pollen allergen Pla o 2 [Platanus orientalis]